MDSVSQDSRHRCTGPSAQGLPQGSSPWSSRVRGGNLLSTCSMWVWAGLTSCCTGCWPETTLSSWPVDLWGAAHHVLISSVWSRERKGGGEPSYNLTFEVSFCCLVFCSWACAPGLCLLLAGFCLHAHRLILRGVVFLSLGFPGSASGK